MADENTYSIGDLVTVQAEFTAVATGALTDATSVVITVEDPDGNQTTPAVTHVSTGIYTAEISPTVAGPWKWRAVGTGTAQAADSGQFAVAADTF